MPPDLTRLVRPAGYDRYIKLWDTERGECVSRFTNKKVPYCVKFNPDEDKQHLFVAGLSDKKILCVSCGWKEDRSIMSSLKYGLDMDILMLY